MHEGKLITVASAKPINTFSYNIQDPLYSLRGVCHSFPIDRLGNLNCYSSFDLSDKIRIRINPNSNVRDYSFASLFYSILKDYSVFSDYKPDKKLAVMWSGGINSTAIVCGFLQNGTKPVIITNQEALRSNLEFMEVVRRYQLEIISLDKNPDFFKKECEKYVLVWGIGSEFVLGAGHYNKDIACFYDHPPVQTLVNYLFNKGIIFDNGQIEYYTEVYEKWIEGLEHDYNLKIATLGEFLWLIYFCCRFNTCFDNIRYSLRKTVNLFPFSDMRLQEWGLYNYKKINSYNPHIPIQYRPLLKEIIGRTYHTETIDNMVKTPTMNNILGSLHDKMTIVTDEKEYHFDIPNTGMEHQPFIDGCLWEFTKRVRSN